MYSDFYENLIFILQTQSSKKDLNGSKDYMSKVRNFCSNGQLIVVVR